MLLDLYSTEPVDPAFADPQGLADDLAPTLVALLAGSLTLEPEQLASPAWGGTHPVQDRMTVWTAVGMLIGGLGVSNESALALLRAYAFRTGTSLDELAARLVDRRISPQQIAAG